MATDIDLLRSLAQQRAQLAAQSPAVPATGLLRKDLGQTSLADLFGPNATPAQNQAIMNTALSLLAAPREQRLSQSIAQALQSGQGALMQARGAEAARTNKAREEQLAQLDERFKQQADITRIDQAERRLNKPSKPLVNVNVGEEKFSEQFGKKFAEKIIEDRTGAEEAVESLRASQEARKLLDSGVITGFGADFVTGLGSALSQAGFDVAEDPVANTQAFVATRAQEVGRIIKLFGAGTGLSDADREFATKAAAGKIDMTEKAIRRILDINDRASRNVIKRFNKTLRLAPEGSIPQGFEINVPEPPKVQGKSIDAMTDDELFDF